MPRGKPLNVIEAAVRRVKKSAAVRERRRRGAKYRKPSTPADVVRDAAKALAKVGGTPTDLLPPVKPWKEPALTSELALVFAQCLSTGVPPDTALRYVDPVGYAALDKKQRRDWLTRWVRSPEVAAAVTTLNGGEWHTLTPEQRSQVALDKHDAELAYFLYRTNFVTAIDETTLGKLKEARTALRARLQADSDGNRQQAYLSLMRDILDSKADLRPPTLSEARLTEVIDVSPE